MRNTLILSLMFCLMGCGKMNQVEGAIEVTVNEGYTTSVQVQPDGNRMVIINRGEYIVCIINLPPAKATATNPSPLIILKPEKK